MAVKTIKVNANSKTGLVVGEQHASLVTIDGSGDSVGLLVDETGVYLKGKLSIMTSPSQIRVGGFWVQNSPWRQMLPSNIAFPNPVLKMDVPSKGMAGMMQTVGWLMGLLV